MTPDVYRVLVMAVETGVALGLRRAYKNSAKPGEDQIAAMVEQAVIDDICEWFKFNNEEDT